MSELRGMSCRNLGSLASSCVIYSLSSLRSLVETRILKRTKIIYVFTEASERKTHLFYFLLTCWWEFDDPEPMSNRHTGAGNLINADTADSEADSLLPLKCAMFRLQNAGWPCRQTHPQSACPGAIAEWTLTWRVARAGSPNTETECYLPLIGYNRTKSVL